MSESGSSIEIQLVPVIEIAAALRETRPFASVDPEAALSGIDQVERVRAAAGAFLIQPGELWQHYWVVLDGEMRAEKAEPDGSWALVGRTRAGDGFGEVPLLAGKTQSPFRVTAASDSVLIRFGEQQFWSLMACCPATRKVVLADMAQRLQAYQVEALHREKLVSLGTMAAGLMHELHNPGAAARRAAAQMRQNLLRLQQLSLRNASGQPRTPEQMECLRHLLELTIAGCNHAAMSSVEQSDAEETLAEWLSQTGVENAYALAAPLVAMGLNQEELDCARQAFPKSTFSDVLNWLEALVSSVALVCTVEESIGRISDLVTAVKKFAYDDRSAGKEVDVHDSLQSTLTILGHKLRMKSLTVEKRFEASPSKIVMRGPALSQVWTNLIDNAADASPEGAVIEIATWTEPGMLGVSIEDHGAGISAEVLPRIFEPFFTTKAQGAGTGLGLEIVHRIVTQNLGGELDVTSEPGRTRFVVRLPLERTAAAGGATA